MTDLISNHIDVSPNEYVTKYSFNRNFQKLVENDINLSTEVQKHINYSTVNSYIDGKTYYKGECIFYKTSSKSMNIYALSCAANVTVNAPSSIYDSAGNLIVVNNDKWKIIGICEELSSNPIDFVNEYVQNADKALLMHASDESLSAHPTKKFSASDSTLLFKSLENTHEDRKTFFYPNHLQTLQPDTTIINGYMRKWDCGLLEYDVIFRVGYFGDTTEDGVSIISANCLKPSRNTQNQFYFKNLEDYNIFNQQNDDYVATNRVKQVNLNSSFDAYHGVIKFPQEFKDLNYMMFASDVKSVETEAKNLIDEKQYYSDYDHRLVIKHLAVVSHVEDEDYTRTLEIPNWIESIEDYALYYIKEANANYPKITFGVNSRLTDIGESAFEGTAFKSIEFPKSVRCIGMNALADCKYLEKVDIWVNDDKQKQVMLDYGVFAGTDKLSVINLHYFSDEANQMLFSATREDAASRISAYTNEEDLSAKLSDPNLQKIYGLKPDIRIVIDDSQVKKKVQQSSMLMNSQEKLGDEVEYVTIDVQSLLTKLNAEDREEMPLMSVAPVQEEQRKQTTLSCIYGNSISSIQIDINDDNSVCISNLSSRFDEVYIDITGLHFNESSIRNLSCNTLKICNLAESQLVHACADGREVFMYGFAPSAFANCDIQTVEFIGHTTEKAIKMTTQFGKMPNVLNLPDSCIVASPNAKYAVVAGSLVNFPTSDFLEIDDTYALISCIEPDATEICIPYGTKIIQPYAFAHTHISSIDIPSTVLSIEDKAFNQMSCLEKITFDPNIRLQHIGNDIFDDSCQRMTDFKMY